MAPCGLVPLPALPAEAAPPEPPGALAAASGAVAAVVSAGVGSTASALAAGSITGSTAGCGTVSTGGGGGRGVSTGARGLGGVIVRAARGRAGFGADAAAGVAAFAGVAAEPAAGFALGGGAITIVRVLNLPASGAGCGPTAIGVSPSSARWTRATASVTTTSARQGGRGRSGKGGAVNDDDMTNGVGRKAAGSPCVMSSLGKLPPPRQFLQFPRLASRHHHETRHPEGRLPRRAVGRRVP